MLTSETARQTPQPHTEGLQVDQRARAVLAALAVLTTETYTSEETPLDSEQRATVRGIIAELTTFVENAAETSGEAVSTHPQYAELVALLKQHFTGSDLPANFSEILLTFLNKKK